jgi:hypothetical protein
MSETKTKTPNPYKWNLPLTNPDPDAKAQTGTFTLEDCKGKVVRAVRKLDNEAVKLGEQSEVVATNIVCLGDEIKRLPLSLAHELDMKGDEKDYADKLGEPPSKLAHLESLRDKKYADLDAVNDQVDKNIDERFIQVLKVTNRNKDTQDITVLDIDLEEVGRDTKMEIIGFFSKKSNGILPKPTDSN